ncbi:MAG: InlB B-repeat-containing protein, partial [Clostridia bacterium]|nr:InlB B-repeat-containing protein [Clostridia bacterium]
MVQETNKFKRLTAALLSALLILTPSNLLPFVSAVEPPETIDVSVPEIIAENYSDLSDPEKNLLKSGLFDGPVLSFTLPGADDGLISVDADAKTITASAFADNGNTWIPESAEIAYPGGSENVVLDADGKGSYVYDGASFTVNVKYVVKVAVADALQTRLLNAPHYFAEAYGYAEALLGAPYYAVSTNADVLNKLIDGSLPLGAKLNTPETVAAIEDIYAQVMASPDAMLDVEELLFNGYDSKSGSKVQYILEHGNDLIAAGLKIYNQIKQIHEDEGIATISNLLGTQDKRRLQVALDTLESILIDTDAAVHTSWGLLDATVNRSGLKSGLTLADYQKLDGLVAALGSPETHQVSPKLLVAASKIVSFNLNRYNVTVTVAAKIVPDTPADSYDMIDLASFTTVLQIAEGATADEIIEAISDSGVETDALRRWVVVTAENFDRAMSAVPSSLTEDAACTISYSPKSYSVTTNYGSALTVPYGFRLTLPVHYGDELVYDYKVNDEDRVQGDVIRITGDTVINRTEGKPWTVVPVNTIIADNYASDLTDLEKAVLNSPAVESGSIRIRMPEAADNLVSVTQGTAGGYSVVGLPFESGVPGVRWMPASGSVIGADGTAISTFTFESGATLVEIAAEGCESVNVEYKLVLDSLIDDSAVIDSLNIPGKLADQAASQKENLDKLYTELHTRLGELTRRRINQIRVAIGNDQIGQAAKDAMQAVLDTCVDPEVTDLDTPALYLYAMLGEYGSQGLGYYYKDNNDVLFANQVNVLNANLSTIIADTNFQTMLDEVGYGDNYGKILDIIATLETIVLDPVDPAVKKSSTSLSDLVTAILAINPARRFALKGTRALADATVDNRSLTISRSLSAAAPGRAIVSITVNAVSSDGNVIATASDSQSFIASVALTDADIAGLNGKIDALVSSLGIDTAHYSTTDTLGLSAGDYLLNPTNAEPQNASVTITYSPNTYTAVITDENGTATDITFPFDNPTIVLPGCTASGMQYKYSFDGREIIVGTEGKSITFTTAQIDSGVIANITRATVDVYSALVIDLVDQLNKAIVSAGMVESSGKLATSFIPMKDANGKFAIVLRISPKMLSAVKKVLSPAAEAITGSNFTYIKIGNEFFRADNDIILQSVVNFLLNSGLNLDDVTRIIAPDGKINEMTLPGATLIGADANGNIAVKSGKYIGDTEKLGGLIVEMPMSFGTSANDEGVKATLYVTIEDFGKRTDDLKTLRDYAVKARKYGNIIAHNGMVDIDVTLPERAFQLYLAGMVALGNTTLYDLNDINLADIVELAEEIIKYIADDETITAKTIDNTADMLHDDAILGRDVNISGRKTLTNYFNKAHKALAHVLDNSEITDKAVTPFSVQYSAKYDINALLNKFSVSDSLRGYVYESRTDGNGSVIGLNGTVRLQINNRSDYQAVVVDYQADGARDKVNLTRDVVSYVAGAGNRIAVMLLQDVRGDLVFNKSAVLDLNGHRINGNLICNGKVIVINSALDTDSGAGVTGTVSGDAIVVSGTYGSDVTSFILPGYEQENGVIKNKFYYFDVDADGNLDIHLVPDYEEILNATAGTAKGMAIDLVADLLVNYAVHSASLKIGSNGIYYADYDDVVEFISRIHGRSLRAAAKAVTVEDVDKVLSWIDCAGITAFANDLIDKLVDFDAVGNAIISGAPVVSYDAEMRPWAVTFEHVTNGDYLTLNVKPNGNDAKTQVISIFVDGSAEIGEFFVKLDEILTVDADVHLDSVSYNRQTKDVEVVGGGSVDAVLDVQDRPDYAVLFGVALAEGIGAGSKRDAIVEGIKTWYETDNCIMSDLKAAIEDLTIAEMVKAFETYKPLDEMLADLGLDGVLGQSAIDLFNNNEKAIRAGYKIAGKIIANRDNASVEAVLAQLGLSRIEDDASRFYKAYDYANRIKTRIKNKLNSIKDKLFGVYETSDYGVYGKTYGSKTVSKSYDVRGDYGVTGSATLDSASFLFKLFPEDIQYKVKVTSASGETLYRGNSLDDGLAAAEAGSLVEIFDTVELENNFDLPFDITISRADLIDFGSSKITLTDADLSKLTTDYQTMSSLDSGVTGYQVHEDVTPAQIADDPSTYVYTLEILEYEIKFVDYDGTEISKTNYHYGDTVTVPADPTRAADETYPDTFAGWDPAVVTTVA